VSYTPTVWVEKVTKVGPTNLNHLENGLQAAAAVADSASAVAAAALPTPAGSNGQFLQRVGGLWVPHTLVAADIPAIADAEIAAGAGIALSKLADPGVGNVVTSAGAGAVAAKPPGYLFDYAQIVSNTGSTATTAATAAAIVTGSAVTYDGSTPVWIEFFAPAFQHSAITTIFFMLYDGSSQVGRLFEINSVAANTDKPCFGKVKLTPSAAAHTYSIRVYSAGAGTATILAGAGGNDVDLPAFMAITKA